LKEFFESTMVMLKRKKIPSAGMFCNGVSSLCDFCVFVFLFVLFALTVFTKWVSAFVHF